jgi:hypothetical protein
MISLIEGKSNIAGNGVFTGVDIKKGQYVCKIVGKKMKWVYNEKTDREKCANWFGIDKNLWIDPSYPLSKLNHSCDPNIGIKGRIMFYALKDVKAGEELTFDYSTSEEEIDWVMKCNCGSKKCRDKMTSIQFLPRKNFDNYLPYIPNYFQKVYKHFNSKK